MGEMKRFNAYEADQRMRDRYASTIVICASISTGIRIARDQNISRTTPSLTSVIAECIQLARSIVEKATR